LPLRTVTVAHFIPPGAFLRRASLFPRSRDLRASSPALWSPPTDPRYPRTITPPNLHDGVRGNLIFSRRARPLHEIGSCGQDARGLPRARVAIPLGQQALRRIDDVVVRQDRGPKAAPAADDSLGRGPEGHHVLAPGVAADDHDAAHAVPREIGEDVTDERLERVNGDADGSRIGTARRADPVRNRGCEMCAGPPSHFAE